MQLPIILAHFGGRGLGGALVVALVFVILAVIALACLETKTDKK